MKELPCSGPLRSVDERIREHLVTDEISIGDYVLTGGEPRLMIIDAVARLIPGVLETRGRRGRLTLDRLLEYPHYTKRRNPRNESA